MVKIQKNEAGKQLVITPNRSMSWQTNKKILLCMFLVNMTIASVWASMGAWMVLPFAGLEIMLVGIGMYYVSWKLSFKEIITIEGDSLILQKGVYFPKHEWHWQCSNSALIKQTSHYRLSAPTLYLKNLNQEIEIGSFLNRAEKKVLREQLIALGIALQIRKFR